MGVIPFRTLIHADWSVSPRKRWMARADFHSGRWIVSATAPANDILKTATSLALQPLLAGFDFPIGLPEGYGRKTGFSDFPSFLGNLPASAWDEFRAIARHPDDISIHRPFYPSGAAKGIKQAHLLQAHGVAGLNGLRRKAEHATATRRAACPIFWTLGGNQVGRGALSGWEEVIRPAVLTGASLWPFDGSLLDLVQRGGLVLAETYPAEAYGHVGIRFRGGQSKRRQLDRQSHSRTIIDWAASRGSFFRAEALDEIRDGFGGDAAGEDRFDAMLGLLGLIEVVIGSRSEGPAIPAPEMAWEGWIMGQASAPDIERRSVKVVTSPTP